MSKVGVNPNRQLSVDAYRPIVASVITHLPDLTSDYHKTRLDVVKCSLETMRRNTGVNCEIMVWDNGSCPELRDWLINEYKPDRLVLSNNVGKAQARTSCFRMYPPETIIATADDDIFYYPDWLKEQIVLLKHYPNVGCVSGWPVRTQFRFHNKSTVAWGKRYAMVFEYGKFISEQEDRDFCTSIGRDYNSQLRTTVHDFDLRLKYKGVWAYATGHHCQMIGYAGVLGPLMFYSAEAMMTERTLEKIIDDAGLLRLTTVNRNTRHIGNILDKELEVLWLNSNT